MLYPPLIFKWGSLVGISIPDGGANGSSPFVAADVEFRPDGFTGTITDDWASVPHCETDFAPYDNPATDHLSRINDPTAGLGDICRHMGVIDSANWRIPTAAEWDLLYREQKEEGQARRLDNNSDWSPGLFAPLHGYAFGPRQNDVRIASDTQVDNADPYDDGAVFLPASGLRNWDNGVIYHIGSEGYFLSATAQSSSDEYRMAFNSTTVAPQQPLTRAYAMPIRCIRE